MNSRPLVTVLLPCFNGEAVVGYALRSILSQTYPALEVLVLDDGSTDGTGAVVAELQARDSRVRLSRSEANCGLIPTLNRGIQEASGELIARMDDDDLAAPTRIKKSVELFLRRPELSAVGTNTRYVSASTGRPVQPRPARCFEPAGAHFMTLLAPPIVHPTLVARATVLRTHPYGIAPDSLHTEDYELFTRMAGSGLSLMNLRERLVTVQVRPHGVSLSHETTQIANFVRCAQRYLQEAEGLTPPEGVHRVLVNRMNEHVTPEDLTAGLALLAELQAAALATAHGQAGRADITRVADLQRVDILSQAILRGHRGVRARAVALLRAHATSLLSRDARTYMAAKLAALPWAIR